MEYDLPWEVCMSRCRLQSETRAGSPSKEAVATQSPVVSIVMSVIEAECG